MKDTQTMQNEDEIDLKRLTLIIRRHVALIAGTMAVFLFLALVYVTVTPARYTAEALLLLDKSVTGTVSEISSVKRMAFEDPALDSEVEVIRSHHNTGLVIKNPESQGYFGNADRKAPKAEVAAGSLLHGLKVERVGKTYVISIKYTATDPEDAATVANAYAEAYITGQLDSLADMSAKTVAWLQEKIKDIGKKGIDAQQRVEAYRLKYNEYQRNERQNGTTGPDSKSAPNLDGMRNLEQEADTYKTLYDSYLEQLEDISAQQSFPVTETRIITRATPPRHKSHPKTVLILGAALIFGAGLGVLIALIRDNMDKTLRRAGQVKRALAVPFIGFFPLRKHSHLKRLPFAPVRGGALDLELHAESMDDPFSLYSETISTLCNAIDSRSDSDAAEKKVIGVISIDRDGGQSAVSSNLALYTSQFAPTVLIEANIRKPSAFVRASGGLSGTGDILQGKASLKDAVLQEPSGGLAVIPSLTQAAGRMMAHLNARNVSGLIAACKKQYDYIIVDCPSLMAVSDVYGFARAADYFVIVAEWGRTLPNNLDFHLKQNGIAKEKVLGVILENTDMKKMEKLYGHKTTASLR